MRVHGRARLFGAVSVMHTRIPLLRAEVRICFRFPVSGFPFLFREAQDFPGKGLP
jgi:hypothetical protein